MALADMMAELRGSVPKIPFSFTKTLINRAWRSIRENNLWSFNMYEASWISPPVITTGTAQVTQGLASIVFDATALAAINAAQAVQPYSLITQRQFRVNIGGIYSIIAFDSGTGTATLDRIFGEPSAADGAYQLYQVYYPTAYKDHRALISVRNPSLFLDLDLDSTRAMIDSRDPQRSLYQNTTSVVPFGSDTRGAGTANASSTLGYPLFELWGQPVAPYVYQVYGVRNGVDLNDPEDTLPEITPEDLLMPKAKYYAYEWCEANKDIAPRASGPDWKFLMGAADDDFKKQLRLYRKQDREFVNNWISIHCPHLQQHFGYYNSRAGVAGTMSPL